jgi:hypothetical protein
MMKRVKFLMALAAIMILASCASTDDFLSVGKVSNTECQKTRASTRHTPMLKLTRQGSDIYGEFIDYIKSCNHGELGVLCKQEGSRFDIKVTDTAKGNEGDIVTLCSCLVNIYFTAYDVEGENFHLIVDDKDIADVSFKEHSIVEINLQTKEVKYGASSDI